LSRKRKAEQRDILPDRRYESLLAAKFINSIMKRGKKSVAERAFYGALDAIAEKVADTEPIEVFNQAIENVKPSLEVKSRRVGGTNYQVPIEVRPARRQALSFRWLLEAARTRGERTMAERLGNELLDAFNRTGTAIRKREETHRMAEANKAFAHYKW
jgi:small subunit ribosomal protein S7